MTLTRSCESSRQMSASAPGLLGMRRESSVRMAIWAYRTSDKSKVGSRKSVASRESKVGLKSKVESRSRVENAPRGGGGVASQPSAIVWLRLLNAAGDFPPSPPGARGRGLRQDLDNDPAVLGAAVLGLVRRDRLVFAVADHVHLVQRNLVLLVEIPLNRRRALEADLLVDRLVADVVGMAFDFDEDVLR